MLPTDQLNAQILVLLLAFQCVQGFVAKQLNPGILGTFGSS